MLRELHISNLAVMTDVRIELHPGLNCFTGATGAGKSLVIGAIEVLLGLRSPAEMLRPGADEGRVSGLFEVKSADILQQIESAADIPVRADGGEILLTRKLYFSGRSSVSLNGNPITLAMLRQVAEGLVDVHGQHDHQYLLKPSNQLDVLDQFGDLHAMRALYRSAYEAWAQSRRKIAELSASHTLRDQQLELYRFQADEIDAAEIDAREYAELEARSAVLQNLEKLKKDAGAVHGALYESEGSILERLKMATAVLAELAELDASVKPIADAAREASIGLEDATYDLSRYIDRLDLDPGELGEVTDRLNLLNRILNKYGQTAQSALEHRARLGAQIAELEKQTDDLSALTRELEPLEKRLIELGTDLSHRRGVVAKTLGPLIEKNLAELGMEKARFSVELSASSEGGVEENATMGIAPRLRAATAAGFDQVEFIVQTNPGQSAQPLRRIASGGELSRIMLALKGILAQSDRVSVLVFDEIDANVGGRLGSIIGEKLRDLARHHQVLCITHLPQIASYADRHLTVKKDISGAATHTRVRRMEGDERLEELAEMIGGQQITSTTRAQARELLDSAQKAPAARRPEKSSPVKAAKKATAGKRN